MKLDKQFVDNLILDLQVKTWGLLCTPENMQKRYDLIFDLQKKLNETIEESVRKNISLLTKQ